MEENIVLVTTRYIKGIKDFPNFVFKEYEFDKTIFRKFFETLRMYITDDCWKNLFGEKKVETVKNFFDCIGVGTNNVLSFDQYLLELQIKEEPTNIFYYYHYPDHDLMPHESHRGKGGAEYINSLIQVIAKAKGINIKNVQLILHRGDLEGIKESEFISILKSLNSNIKNISLNTFSHDENHPIVSRFIFNIHFFDDCLNLPVEFLNEWLNPDIRNASLLDRFKSH